VSISFYHFPLCQFTYHRYDTLKKYIYQLEKQQYGDGRPYHDMEANEYAALIDPSHSTNSDSLFVPLLNQELKKIVLFYQSQEKELLDEVTDLEEQAEKLEEAGLAAGERYMDDDDDDDDDEDDDSISRSPERRRRSISFQRRLGRARCEYACVLYHSSDFDTLS
jgi:phosphate transporter